MYEKLFGPLAAARGVTLPPFDDAFYNVSIMFVNSHESLSPALSAPPNVINIAGYHMDEIIPPLPKVNKTVAQSRKIMVTSSYRQLFLSYLYEILNSTSIVRKRN